MNHCGVITLIAIGLPLVAGRLGQDATKELIVAERAYNQALTRGDWKTIYMLETEDLIFTAADGTVSGKAAQIDELKSGSATFDSIEMSEVKVQDFGKVAVVTGKLIEKGHYKSEDLGGVYRFTDVWVKRNDKWLLVAGQETRKP